jgi:hypothetical protein
MTRFYTWLALMAVLWGPPCLISLGLAYTPDVVTATAGIGEFVSSSAAQGGFFSPALTTVQTTTGSVVVTGSFSGARGQRLALDRKLKSGLQLCVTDSVGSCALVSGTWPGRLQATQHERPRLAFLAPMQRNEYLQQWYFGAFLLILPLTALVALVGRTPSDDASGEQQSTTISM